LLKQIEELIGLGDDTCDLLHQIRSGQFDEGFKCPHCKSINAIKHGKSKGKQRYKCKDCTKTFSDTTLTPFAYSKKDLSKWRDYAEYMMDGYSLRKIASLLEINLNTAFLWRHKILDAIRLNGRDYLSGIVEADETLFLESFKGNHSKSKHFSMPRPSRKRGGKATFRGISSEQICVLFAMDRNSNIIGEPACKGRISSEKISKILSGHISYSSILCTDKHRSYVGFAKKLGLDLKQVKSASKVNGIYHIQHINSLHGRLKGWIADFKGVSTKYLVNYMYWFKFLEDNKYSDIDYQISNLFKSSSSFDFRQITKTLRDRPPTIESS